MNLSIKYFLIMGIFFFSMTSSAGEDSKVSYLTFMTKAKTVEATVAAVREGDWKTLVELHKEAGSFDFRNVLEGLLSAGDQDIPEEVMTEIIDRINDGYSDKRGHLIREYLLRSRSPNRFRLMYYVIEEFSPFVLGQNAGRIFEAQGWSNRHDIRLLLIQKLFPSDLLELIKSQFRTPGVVDDPRYYWMAAYSLEWTDGVKALRDLLAKRGENPPSPWLELQTAMKIDGREKRREYLVGLIGDKKIDTKRTCAEVVKH